MVIQQSFTSKWILRRIIRIFKDLVFLWNQMGLIWSREEMDLEEKKRTWNGIIPLNIQNWNFFNKLLSCEECNM
jgi:hypothetical protein